ncbi:MAG: VWA domain-containing protein [Candidatus Gastranaerophilales bacterium]|nr:VWA domain-containing protein [Candidatus Gastranaerophilales bacterium]
MNRLVIIFSILFLFFSIKTFASFQSQENVLIILDSSYSMSEKVFGEKKIEIAKRAITDVINEISPSTPIGLRIYGHKTGFLGFSACSASELKVPIAPYSKYAVKNELSKIKPVGETPITYSLKQAVEQDFTGINGKKRIVLVSDGKENCDISPCDFIIEQKKRGMDFTIDVIGYDLGDEDAKNQLKCVALTTKGQFYTANNEKALTKSLKKSLKSSTEVEGKILNKN